MGCSAASRLFSRAGARRGPLLDKCNDSLPFINGGCGAAAAAAAFPRAATVHRVNVSRSYIPTFVFEHLLASKSNRRLTIAIQMDVSSMTDAELFANLQVR